MSRKNVFFAFYYIFHVHGCLFGGRVKCLFLGGLPHCGTLPVSVLWFSDPQAVALALCPMGQAVVSLITPYPFLLLLVLFELSVRSERVFCTFLVHMYVHVIFFIYMCPVLEAIWNHL